MGAEAFGQFVCVQLGGAVFSVSGGLTGAQWIICLLFGAGEIPWNLLVCCVPADYVPDALLNFKDLENVQLRGGNLEGCLSIWYMVIDGMKKVLDIEMLEFIFFEAIKDQRELAEDIRP